MTSSPDPAPAASATLDPVTTPTPPAPERSGSGHRYGRMWRSVPRELGFLLLAMPIAVVTFIAVVTLFSTGVSTIALFFGVFFIIAALLASRAFGTFEMARLEWAGRPPIPRPAWTNSGDPAGFWAGLLRVLSNGHYWLHLLHAMAVNFVVSIITWIITVFWLSVALAGVTYWLWVQWLPAGRGEDDWLYRTVLGGVAPWLLPGLDATVEPLIGEAIFQVLLGVIFLATLPFVTHGLTLLHDVIARPMLGAWRSEFLQREVADLSESRGAVLAAEDQSLRRLERDIHDGPQQRLIRMQMDLAAADRKLGSDPESARALIAEAMQQSRDTLEELRALSRGFAPPILQDRGLVAGLASLAATSTVPVRVSTELDPALALPPAVERSAYFVAAELLANVAKHSGATDSVLHSAITVDPTTGAQWLTVTVTDNGLGGAIPTEGHGLHGLTERLRGLRGSLSLDSPAGGPTVAQAFIPLEFVTPGRPPQW
ncbi:sensor histidine kinase [Planctomonas psychrotolerans]|uniref:sensor histidine kinase n=1 Tax=Planctomonas psychrotolerans TaxID=2528712 RepID=UPI00123BF21B|nr:sensor domain-containing protein [Planctomonas psychrotolerans]